MNASLSLRASCVLIAAVAAVAPAHAKLPDPAHCVVPRFMDIVGQSEGVPDPGGRFTVMIRDFVNNPQAWVSVDIHLSPQCSETRLCVAQANGQTVDCYNGIVRGYSDHDGNVSFTITGAADDMGGAASNAGAGSNCLRIYADGIPLGNATAVVYDVNGRSGSPGNPGVNGLDLAIVKQAVGDAGLNGSYRGRFDYTHDGRVNGADLARFLAIVGSGGSASNCLAVCP